LGCSMLLGLPAVALAAPPRLELPVVQRCSGGSLPKSYTLIRGARLDALKRLLKHQGATLALDGDVCIWRVGDVRGEDGRSYAVYQYTYIFGEAQRAHHRI